MAVLAFAALNLTFRLGREIVTDWDESLYAISALEMRANGHWIGTTFLGALDYYNSKPPLNVWLIALAFKLFGANLVSLRLVSVVSAWLTVAVLQGWSRRIIGPAVALLSGIILSTSFGFIYVHSGRSANPDALFTLLILLTAVTVWAMEERPTRIIWLGPIAAAVFLLRGMAVLMVATIVAAAWAARPARQRSWTPPVIALLLFAIPVTAWVAARWQLDQWQFLERLFTYDFLARSFTVIEEHPGTPLYYLNILQKHQFDWMLAAAVAWWLYPIPWPKLGTFIAFWRGHDALSAVLGAWSASVLIVPTLMRTKLPWYLNTFYPVFALGTAWILVHALCPVPGAPRTGKRRMAVAAVLVIVIAAAESRLLWYSFHYRDLGHSSQGLLLAERERLGGALVFRDHWNHGDLFVLEGVAGGRHRDATSLEDFVRNSRPGDYLLSSEAIEERCLSLVQSNERYRLYRRFVE